MLSTGEVNGVRYDEADAYSTPDNALILQVNQLIPNNIEIPTGQQQRSELFDTLADRSFTQEEMQLWDHDTRRAIVALSNHGAVELVNLPHLEGSNLRQIVVDTDFLKEDMIWKTIEYDIGKIAIRNSFQMDALAELSLKMGDVISSEQYNKYIATGDANTIELKPLFYVAGEDPIKIENIKGARYHLGLWEVAIYYPESYPSTTRDHYSPNEIAIAHLVHNPNFGDGYRNKERALVVRYPDGNQRGITGHFFKEFGFTGIPGGTGECIFDKPKEYLSTYYPDLIDAGVLELADFKGQVGPGGYLETHRLVDKTIGSKGKVMIDRVQYFVGSEFSDKRYTISKLSDDYACIVERRNKGRGVFLEPVKVLGC